MILDPQAAPRDRMVAEQLASKGIRDERVLEAFRRVPRHLFVAPGDTSRAYGDHPLAIGHDQTISQPYIVACMTQALELTGGERVLEAHPVAGMPLAFVSQMLAQEGEIDSWVSTRRAGPEPAGSRSSGPGMVPGAVPSSR